MSMFRGIQAVNLDAKGRFVLPSRYRERFLKEESTDVVITIDTEERCLLLYPVEQWSEIESKLADLPSFNAPARRIQRLLMGHATDLELDAQGRLLLTPPLRQYANLKKRMVLVGQGNKIELWDEAHWQVRRDSWLEEEANTDADLPDDVKSIVL
jgi:MraZ protein